MSLIAKVKGDYKPCPPGLHLARCVGLVDLGTQVSDFNQRRTTAQRLWITWELPNETNVFKEEDGAKPYLLSLEVTNSLGKKANLRSILENWRNKEFTDEELKGFDMRNIVGTHCMLQVIHKKNQSGDTKAKIASVTSVPKGTEKIAGGTPIIIFSLDEFSEEAFEKLPDFLKDKIKASPEYARIANPGHDYAINNNDEEPPLTDDDVPF